MMKGFNNLRSNNDNVGLNSKNYQLLENMYSSPTRTRIEFEKKLKK